MSPVIRNPYKKASLICLAIGLSFVAIAIATIIYLSRVEVPRNYRESLWAIPFFLFPFAFGLLTGSFLAGLLARRIDQIVKCIRSEELLAHWEYPAAEWAAFQIAEFPLRQRDFRNHLLWPFAISIPAGIILLVVKVFSEDKPDLRSLLFVVVAVSVFFAMTFALAYYLRVIRPLRSRKRQLLNPPPSYLHSDFVYANGEFVLGLLNQQLTSVQVLSGEPPMIEFMTLTSTPRTGQMTEVRRVLVPRGQEHRAAEIVDAIRSAWRLG